MQEETIWTFPLSRVALKNQEIKLNVSEIYMQIKSFSTFWIWEKWSWAGRAPGAKRKFLLNINNGCVAYCSVFGAMNKVQVLVMDVVMLVWTRTSGVVLIRCGTEAVLDWKKLFALSAGRVFLIKWPVLASWVSGGPPPAGIIQEEKALSGAPEVMHFDLSSLLLEQNAAPWIAPDRWAQSVGWTLQTVLTDMMASEGHRGIMGVSVFNVFNVI